MMQFTMAAYSKNFTPEDAMNITRRTLLKSMYKPPDGLNHPAVYRMVEFHHQI